MTGAGDLRRVELFDQALDRDDRGGTPVSARAATRARTGPGRAPRGLRRQECRARVRSRRRDRENASDFLAGAGGRRADGNGAAPGPAAKPQKLMRNPAAADSHTLIGAI